MLQYKLIQQSMEKQGHADKETKLKVYCINVLYGILCICCEMWWKYVEIGFQVR